MTTITAAAGGGNWTVGATWVGGIAPTAADDAALDATSGNVTIDTGAVARSLDCTGYTGTLTHTSGITLALGDATAGAGNSALKLVAGMTYTLVNATTSAISFISTSATQQTITTGGKTLGSWTINGGGSSYILGDANTAGVTATVTVTTGTFNTGNLTCSWGNFSSDVSTTRTITLGTSSISITGGSGQFNVLTATGLTFSAASSTITFTGASGYMRSSQTYGTVIWSAAGGAAQAQPFTCATLTITGSASKTADFAALGNITVTGTLTIAGNSATNRILVHSGTLSTVRAITAAVVLASNADFKDIRGSGAGSWDLSAAAGGSGDGGGNAGITFTASATQAHIAGAGGSWSDVTRWTSRVPLPQDDVTIDVTVTGTLTVDMPRLGRSVDFTGFAGTAAFSSVANAIFGSLTLAAGMTSLGTQVLTLAGRSNYMITSAGVPLTQALTIAAPAWTYLMRDNLTTADALTLTAGTLATAGYTLTYGSLVTGAGVLRLGAGSFLPFFY